MPDKLKPVGDWKPIRQLAEELARKAQEARK